MYVASMKDQLETCSSRLFLAGLSYYGYCYAWQRCGYTLEETVDNASTLIIMYI
jgi:hypothetical protein